MSSKTEIIQSDVCSNNGELKRKRSLSRERPHDILKDATPSSIVDLDLALQTKKPRFLRILIPPAATDSLADDIPDDTRSLFSASDTNSLFDGLDNHSLSVEQSPSTDYNDNVRASRVRPPIPGLFFDPSVVISSELADKIVSFCMRTYFVNPQDNQVMLFGRFTAHSGPLESSAASGFPPVLLELLDHLSQLLRPVLQAETYRLLFPVQPKQARQAIINLYQPGEGITPHVDLLGRYADGIIGVSFFSGSVMRFDHVNAAGNGTKLRWDVYLPERTIIVLSKEARFAWTHGIDRKTKDYVCDPDSSDGSSARWIERGTRMSVTFRWMLPGADVVGDGPS